MATQAKRHIPARVVVMGIAVAGLLWTMPPQDWIPFGPGPQAATAPVTSNANACGRCGVVESAHQVGMARSIGEVGMAAGALGNDLTTLLAVAMSALTGNRFAEDAKATSIYQVTVRFADGSSRVLTSVGTRAWARGDRVKVIRGLIEPNG